MNLKYERQSYHLFLLGNAGFANRYGFLLDGIIAENFESTDF